MSGLPWDQPGADPVGDMRAAWEQARRSSPVGQLLDAVLADLPPLTAWQQHIVDAALYGRQVVFTVPRSSGRSVVEQALRALPPPPTSVRGARPTQTWVDEVPHLWDVPPGPTDQSGWLIDLCTQGLP